MYTIKHEIVTDDQGVVLVDGVKEDLAAALERFAVEASEAGSPVVIRTTDPVSPPLLFEVDDSGLLTPVEESAADDVVHIDEHDSDAVDGHPSAEMPPAPATLPDETAELGGPLEEAFGDLAPAGLPEQYRTPRRSAPSRRWVLAGAGVLAAVVLCTGAVWWVTSSASGSAPVTPAPTASTTSTAPGVVTLPGWSTKPAWKVDGVDAAATFGSNVIGVTDGKVTVWEAKKGREISTASLAGTGARVLAGDVDKFAALAAVSDAQALVWVDGQTAPQTIDLSGGRALETRTGSFFVTGPDRTFWLVTEAGEVPLTAPGSQLIVLGGGPEQVMWASGAGHVITASPNGTVLTDAALQAPAEGATVTPKTGWLRASTTAVTVVGWTLPDGQTVTGIHDTKTGALLGTIPGSGKGLLQPNRTSWVADGQRVSLVDGKATPLPTGFIPSAFLGGDLLGAMTDGGDALLPAGESAPVPAPASTVRPVAADGVLVTLTGRQLAVFSAKK